MRWLARASRATYGRHLDEDELVLATVDAFATGTGPLVAWGAGIGSLAGALAWTFLAGSGLLPLLVFGALAGALVGIGLATNRARDDTGPGALIVKLALTSNRLLLLRGRSGVKLAPLRSFPLGEITGLRSAPTRIGNYRRLTIDLSDGTEIPLVAEDANAVADLVEQHRTISQQHPPATQGRPNG